MGMQDAGTWCEKVSIIKSLVHSRRGTDPHLVARFLQTRATHALLTLNGLHTVDFRMIRVEFAATQAAGTQKSNRRLWIGWWINSSAARRHDDKRKL